MGTRYRKPSTHNMLLESSRVLRIAGTDYKLAVPFSVQEYGNNNKFTIGHLKFYINNNHIHCMGKIPASWLVPLNA